MRGGLRLLGCCMRPRLSKANVNTRKVGGISQLNNFQYECGSIKVWRAFGVRVGSWKKALPRTKHRKRHVEKASSSVEKSTISDRCGRT